jgi:hypothetical protein
MRLARVFASHLIERINSRFRCAGTLRSMGPASDSSSGSTPGAIHNATPDKSLLARAVPRAITSPPNTKAKLGKYCRYSASSGYHQRHGGSSGPTSRTA